MSVVQLNAPLHERCRELEAELLALGFTEGSLLDHPKEDITADALRFLIAAMTLMIERKTADPLYEAAITVREPLSLKTLARKVLERNRK